MENPRAEVLGSEPVTADETVTLLRTGVGFRLQFSDTGTFDVDGDGRFIQWYRPTDVDMADAVVDITSRVMALTLHAAGVLCLHGSAVAWGARAVGFLAPKFHGKSTLALATLETGAKLLTDDTLPVDMGPPPRARPGLAVARLWPDSAEVVRPAEPVRGADDKLVFPSLPMARVATADARLDALYVLAPRAEDRHGAACWRMRLPSSEAALLVMAHTKLGGLLRGSELPGLFDRAAALASAVPVYRLNLVRDFSRLAEVAALIRTWHDDGAQAGSRLSEAG